MHNGIKFCEIINNDLVEKRKEIQKLLEATWIKEFNLKYELNGQTPPFYEIDMYKDCIVRTYPNRKIEVTIIHKFIWI